MSSPAGVCSLGGKWRSQYYDSVEGNLLVADELTFGINDTAFLQVLEPYPTGTCDVNTLIWEGTYIQLNQTNFRLSFIFCEISQLGCLNCTPAGDFQVTSKSIRLLELHIPVAGRVAGRADLLPVQR